MVRPAASIIPRMTTLFLRRIFPPAILFATAFISALAAPLEIDPTPRVPSPAAAPSAPGTTTNTQGQALTADSRSFFLNGLLWVPILGEFHWQSRGGDRRSRWRRGHPGPRLQARGRSFTVDGAYEERLRVTIGPWDVHRTWRIANGFLGATDFRVRPVSAIRSRWLRQTPIRAAFEPSLGPGGHQSCELPGDLSRRLAPRDPRLRVEFRTGVATAHELSVYGNPQRW